MRRILIIVAMLAVVASAEQPTRGADVPDLGTRRQGVDWPRFLGPTGDSKSPERGILKQWPEQGPRLVWQLRLAMGYCMPAISRGRLFVFDRTVHDARLRCLESETGKPIWEFTYPTDYQDMYDYDGGPRASPIVDDDRVYIFGPDGMLNCLSVLDGKRLWNVDTAKQFHVVQNFFGVGSTPAIEGNLLIVQIGGSPASADPDTAPRIDQAKGDGSDVVALDKRTGEVKYRFSDELASYSSPVLATIGGRRWCFVFSRGGLIGFDPLTGKQDFHYPWRAKLLESVNASSPVVVGDTVFISECYQVGSSLLRVHPGGYDVVWRDPPGIRDEKAMKLHWNTPVCVDGFLYGSSGRQPDSADLRCIEFATGKVKWSEPDLTRTSLLYVDGHFVCLTEAGQLLLVRVNPEKFDPVAKAVLMTKDEPIGGVDFPDRKLLTYPCWAAPILSHGLLYVRGKDRLACVELIPSK
jgi:outer membrane protein assembly factor BamB